MTQEEKLEEAKRLYKDANADQRYVLERLFPQLIESEDEKIRKEIIAFIKKRDRSGCDYDYDKWIAWLEKQGEKSLADKVEPKFHEGDWIITDQKHNWLVDEDCSTTCHLYRLVASNGEVEVAECEVIKNHARLWNIQDAKDGDVIYSRHNTESFEWIGIFKSLDKENKRVFFYGFWHTMAKTFSVCGNEAYILYDDFYPATKEQRELLFAKMKEAGYEWNSEKKKLKKIEQKPTWSEEDEKVYSRILDLIHTAAYANYDVDEDGTELGEYAKIIRWLKSIKERYIWKPSDEQIEALSAINVTGGISYTGQGQELINLYNDLKKLKG